MQFDHREVLAAAKDHLSISMGVKPSRPHPLAESVSLRDICYALGNKVRPQLSHELDAVVMARGLATADFSRMLAEGAYAPTVTAYDKQAEHNLFAAGVEVVDFRPTSFPGVDNDLSLEPLMQNSEVRRGLATLVTGAASVGLTTYAKAFEISREAILADQTESIRSMFASLGTNVARLESRLIAACLEANAAMDDGQPVFHATYNNILASAYSSAAFGTAAGMLRTQLTSSGQRADLRAQFVVCAPDIEYSARLTLFQAGMDVQVVALADIPAGRWYVMADPFACPTVVVLRLRGEKRPVRVEEKKLPFGSDGTWVQVSSDLGTTILSRVGIVRGGV